jgi:hypothetical protein
MPQVGMLSHHMRQQKKVDSAPAVVADKIIMTYPFLFWFGSATLVKFIPHNSLHKCSRFMKMHA